MSSGLDIFKQINNFEKSGSIRLTKSIKSFRNEERTWTNGKIANGVFVFKKYFRYLN